MAFKEFITCLGALVLVSCCLWISSLIHELFRESFGVDCLFTPNKIRKLFYNLPQII